MPTLHSVGFIGLGAMGYPMARNIAQKGDIKVHTFDTNTASVERAGREWGALPCRSAREVATASQLVFSMLPNDEIVRTVALGDASLREGAHPDLIYADFSTISPHTLREVADALPVRVLGGACSRGVAAAEEGDLAIYVDGDPAVVNIARPIMECFATDILYTGSLSTAKVVKLVNNMIVGGVVAATAEAMALAARVGITPDALVPVLQRGSGNSYAVESHFAKFLLRDDLGPGKFRTTYIIKDLGLGLQVGDSLSLPAPLASLATAAYRGATATGWGEHYYPIIYRWFERIANLAGEGERA